MSSIAIGFVEHEVLAAVQLAYRLREVVEQAARRTDDDVEAAAEGVLCGPMPTRRRPPRR